MELIFIDIDGVLANFIKAAFQAHGSEYDEATYPKLQWSIATVLGITESEFWAGIDRQEPDFWPCLEVYEWAHELVDTALRFADVKLLSSPSRHHSCHAGKRMWVDKHFPKQELILCKSKELMARPGRLFIDDSDANAEKWLEAGGPVITFPQPWNKNHRATADRWDFVMDSLHVHYGVTA